MKLAVDIEVDLREAEVQVVSARLQPTLDANEVEDVPPLLLFADLSVGAEISPVGGAAAMLEVVRTLIALKDTGNFELVRPVVFLWSSDPAAVRAFVVDNDLAPVAAIELRDFGAGHVLNPVMHAVVPSGTHASWLTSWVGLALSQSLQYQDHTEPDLGVEWIVREQVFPLDCDRFLLNREDVTFPTVLLSESPPCLDQQMPAPTLESSVDELRWKTIVTATLEVIRPLVTGEPLSNASLNRVAERILTRYWQRAIGAFYLPGSAHQQDPDSNEGRVRGLASLEDARKETDAELEAWSDMLPEAELAELQLWIAAIDDLMRGRLQEAPQATAAAPLEPKPSDAIVGPDPKDGPSAVSASRTTPSADQGVQRQPTPSPVKTPAPLSEPIATPTPALPRPTPEPRIVVPTPTAVPPTPVPDLPAPTPTPAGIKPMAVQADAYLVQVRRDLEDGNCESALAKLRRISDQTPEQHTQARALIATVEKRMETSRKAFSEGIGHLTERRQSMALAAFKRVEPCTADEYRQAQKRIQSIQEPASQSGGDGDCESLGVLRATRAQGDGRTVSGSLNIGEKAVYCFGAEMPGYGDLEVLVPMGFRAEGMGLIVAQGFKTFSNSDVRYVRYYAEKLTPGTRVEVTLHNKQSSTAEFECEFYLYPR
ncbi:MAG: hypothetical protein GY906_26150 [bacterium]|nr:hypothetical protein [bacterium]